MGKAKNVFMFVVQYIVTLFVLIGLYKLIEEYKTLGIDIEVIAEISILAMLYLGMLKGL